MDLPVVLAISSGALIIILLFFVLRPFMKGKSNAEQQQAQRVPAARGARARMRAAAAAAQRHDIVEEEEGEHEKVGAKKRAKLEAKAEKKAQREAEEREREEKKKKKELAEEDRKLQEEREHQETLKKEQEAKKAKEEKERREQEEYLKLKSAFSIEEEGYDEVEIESKNALQDFICFIQDMKVVTLEDLAVKFRMKTQSVIDRIQDLQNEGRLTGVIDDRGKYIYISKQELQAVAKFVKQRGRVSLTELAENSTRLINLVPNIQVET